MAKKQPPRGKPPHRPRTAAAVRRQAAARRRRNVLTVVSGLVVVAIVLALVFAMAGLGNKSASDTTTSSSTTSTPTSTTLASAAGKPCVATKGALPKGAPAVPVEVGPPPTKLITKDLKVGTGAVVTASQTVTVDYIGVACSTGKIFDSSYSRGEPASFALTGVIQGWTQGIPGMKVGGERLLGIPSALAYGPSGQPPDIAPDEPLWFVVHVVSAK